MNHKSGEMRMTDTTRPPAPAEFNAFFPCLTN